MSTEKIFSIIVTYSLLVSLIAIVIYTMIQEGKYWGATGMVLGSAWLIITVVGIIKDEE